MLAAEIKKRLEDDSSGPFFSLEFYPPLKEQNVDEFVDTLKQLGQANPLFVDITWSRRNDPGNLSKRNSSCAVALFTKELFGQSRTMLHICCNGYTKAQTLEHLETAFAGGIRNIMALRGDDLPEFELDTPQGEKTKYFALDLVKWIREEYANGKGQGDCGQVTIGVAGHIHPPDKEICYEDSLAHLKEKVDAGADFITTQFFLDVRHFEKFHSDCRALGIQVPILPGILLFKSAISLRKIAGMANVPIPAEIAQVLEANKGDLVAIQNYSIQLAFDMCRHILSTGSSKGIHLFTLNQKDMCSKLLKRLGFWPTIASEPALSGHLENGHKFAQLNGNAAKEGHGKEEVTKRKKSANVEMLNGNDDGGGVQFKTAQKNGFKAEMREIA